MASARRAVLELLLASLIWGAAFVVVDDLLHHSSPLTYLCIRFTLASALLAGAFWPYFGRVQPGEVRGGAVLGLALALILILQAVGQVFTTPSKSAFITGLGIPLTPLFCWLLLKQRVSTESVAGLLVAEIGFYVLAWPRGGASFNAGDLLTLGCAVAGALQIVYLGEYLGRGADFRILSMMQIFFAAIFLYLAKGLFELAKALVPGPALASLLNVEARPFEWSWTMAGQLVFLAALATALVFILQARAQREITQTQAAVIIGMEPVFAAVISVLAGVEPLTIALLAGGLLMVTGIVVSQMRWSGGRGGQTASRVGGETARPL